MTIRAANMTIYLMILLFTGLTLWASFDFWRGPTQEAWAPLESEGRSQDSVMTEFDDAPLRALVERPIFDKSREPPERSELINRSSASIEGSSTDPEYHLVGVITQAGEALALLVGSSEERMVTLRQGETIGLFSIDSVDINHIVISKGEDVRKMDIGERVSVIY